MDESKELLQQTDDIAALKQEEPAQEMEHLLAQETAPARPRFAVRKQRKMWKGLPMLLCFLLPFCVGGVAFLISLIYTEGTNMLLASDGWHQYYPFLVAMREKLLSGGSMEYSWVVGMGGGYPSLYAYYLASPMYLLSVLIPLDILPHYFTLMTIVKLALAGYCMGWFLRLVYKRNDLSLPFFGLAYAFCAWAAGYYWNIMWLDTFALLPLLIAGTVCLLRDGKFRLYILALALSLWCNYYIAFFCCIFVLLCFVGYCICCWNGFGNFMRRFLRIGICTLIGAGIACILLLPMMLAMQTTYSAKASEFSMLRLNIAEKAFGNISTHGNLWTMFTKETLPGLVDATRQVFGGLMPATVPTHMNGLPNVFCGLSTVMLSIYYFCCRKISKREKVFNLCLLAFLLSSFAIRYLDYAWHGFHFPNSLPYRFSFLFSFVLVAMAYRAYCLMDDFKPWQLCFVILPITALLIANAYLQGMSLRQQILTLVVFVGMLGFFLLYYIVKRVKKPQGEFASFVWSWRKSIVSGIALLLMLCEMAVSLASGIDAIGLTKQYHDDGRVEYPRLNENVQALLSYLDDVDDEPFYRMEVTTTQTLNDAALNGYNGLSSFNSSANANFNRLTRALGLASWVGSNRYIYYESSPFTNLMCGVKYLLDRTGNHFNTYYNTRIASSGNVNLLQNEAYISLGFMTDSALADYVALGSGNDPLKDQEEMFRMATGIEEPLYTHYTATDIDTPLGTSVHLTNNSDCRYSYSVADAAEEKQKVSLFFQIPENGLYIAQTQRPNKAGDKVKVYCNGFYLYTVEAKARMLFCAGSFRKGDEVELVYELPSGQNGSFSLTFAKQNNAVFDAALQKLRDEPLVITDFADGYVKGTVEALSDGLFYTSISYEPGWKAYVDGKEVKLAAGYDAQNEDVQLSDAVVCFPLAAGKHEIELVYTAPGLKVGAIITVVSILAFAALWFILRKEPVLLADQPYKGSKPLTMKKSLLLTACATVLVAAAAYLTIHGAKYGYASVLRKLKPEEAFLLMLAVLCICLAIAAYHWYHLIRLLWRRAKDTRRSKALREEEQMLELLPIDETEPLPDEMQELPPMDETDRRPDETEEA